MGPFHARLAHPDGFMSDTCTPIVTVSTGLPKESLYSKESAGKLPKRYF